MLSASAYVPWQPIEDYERVVSHPTEVCEPINLAATAQPALVYKMLTDGRGLSTMQVETIQLAMQSFAARGSFLLGDATGVGKGRTIAGLIAEVNRAQPHARVAWVTATMQLFPDAKSEYAAVDSATGKFEDVVHFTSYTALTSTPRANALADWLLGVEGPAAAFGDGDAMAVLVLDECHALRNGRSIAAQVVEHAIETVKTRRSLKILYSSATACSTPKHIGYLGRLGLFGTRETPFADLAELSKALRAHGPSLMELMAIDLRSRGAYVSRQLSFANVEVSNCVVELNSAQRSMYDACVRALSENDEAPLRGSAQQSFFQRIVTGLKVDRTIAEVERHVAAGSSVVISLVNTGEASLRRTRTRTANERDASVLFDLPKVGDDDALSELGVSVDDLPTNPLDAIVDHFGVEAIAELTGRRHRLVRRSGGAYAIEKNPSLRAQVSDFQSGKKHVAVLSRAGGIGISLHDAEDGRPRVHIILELPWSAEDILQQMGRTHRSSSLRSPSYVLMTSDVPAELRFASAIVNKLQSYGALVKADRRSCSFGFFKVPRWNISERRSIGLYLATAEAYDGTPVISLSRKQSLALCGADRRESDAHVKERLVRLLHSEPQERTRVLVGVAQSLYPHDVTMLVRRWHPACHHHFPAAFRRQVTTLLLCAQAWETSATLGILTQDLLFTIVEHLACPVSHAQAQAVAHEFRRVDLDNLGPISIDVILNRMLGMSLEVQRCVFDVADALVVPETPAPSNCLLRYASERAGACVDATISEISYASFDAITQGVCVAVAYDIRMPPPPPRVEGCVWRHQKSGRVCWVDETTHRILFTDGTEVRLAAIDRGIMRSRDYFQCSVQHWDDAVSRARTYAARRLHRLPRRFLLATTHSMRLWESSGQRVLRVPPTADFPHGIVGLLMSSRS